MKMQSQVSIEICPPQAQYMLYPQAAFNFFIPMESPKNIHRMSLARCHPPHRNINIETLQGHFVAALYMVLQVRMFFVILATRPQNDYIMRNRNAPWVLIIHCK